MPKIIKYSSQGLSTFKVSDYKDKIFDIISGEVIILPTDNDITVRTLLGSCIAICLIDKTKNIMGINHFLTPAYTEDLKSGLFSTNKMLSEMIKAGAEVKNLEAKVYGGSNINKLKLFKTNIGTMNADFAFDYLKYKKIPITQFKVNLTNGLVIQVSNGMKVNIKELG